MTREEAQEFLTKISYTLGNMEVEYLREKDGEKMREAIMVLKQDISVTEFADRCKECGARYEKLLKQKFGEWIPVIERLPEKKGDYLVTQKATFTDYVYISAIGYALNLHDVDEYDFADKKRPGWYEYDIEWGYRELDDVIAWMPLPEPYKASPTGEESEVEE